MFPRALLLGLLAAVPAPAQSNLLVVDINRGAGSHYRTIQEAVDAAAAGDRIQVRTGNYPAFRINGKPLTIVGQPGAALSGFLGAAITVLGIPADSDCAVSGIAVNTGNPYSPISVLVHRCEGRVLLDTITAGLGSTLQVVDSPRVAMVRVGGGRGGFALDCQRSGVNITDSTFQGLSNALSATGVGATLVNSVVSLAGCSVSGANEVFFARPGPAMSLNDSYVTVTDDGSNRITAGQTSQPVSTFVGRGNVVLDARVVVRASGGAAVADPGIVLGTRHRPLLTASRPQSGRSSLVQLAGTPAGNYALAVGLPADWQLVPGLFGARWLDPATSFVVGLGALDANGRASLQVPLPTGTAVVGIPLMWQGVADEGLGTAPAYSNPVGFLAWR